MAVRAVGDSASPSIWPTVLAGIAAFRILAAVISVAAGLAGPFTTPAAAAAATMVVFAGAAGWLLVSGRGDRRAASLALFFLIIASTLAGRFLVPLYESRLMFMMRGVHPSAFLAWSLWTFVRHFPRTIRYSRADSFCRIAQQVAGVIGWILFAANVLLAHGAPYIPEFLLISRAGNVYWSLLLASAAPALPTIWLRARWSPPGERRRLALFTVGLLAGLVPVVAELLFEIMVPAFYDFMEAGGRRLTAPLFFAVLLIVPVVTAYAVVVDRVLDVRITIGQALKYVLARNTLAVLTAIPFGAVAWYAYAHRGLTVTALLSGWRGIAIGIATFIGLLLSVARRPMLAVIDRFFRQAVDLATELPRVTSSIRNARSVTEIADAVEADMMQVVHSDTAAVLFHDAAKGAFAPLNGSGPTLSDGSALATLLRVDSAPLSVHQADSRSMYPLLPAADRAWVDQTRAAVLVPLVGSLDAAIAVLVVGPRRSDDGFGRDELSFMATVASAAALAIEARRAAAAVGDPDGQDEPASECRACGLISAPGSSRCPCGSPCHTAPVPPILAGKFRVEQFLGAGGMGVVYRARDLELDRAVALKTLVRISGQAADRLGTEARIMAAVVHPNLATIYGVERWRGTPTLVLELLEGGTLVSKLGKPQPIDEVLRLGLALAPALERLHQEGVLHRDIKPSNIGFSHDGVPKLLDFGLASFFDEVRTEPAGAGTELASATTATQSVVAGGRAVAGTPLYLSPEAASGAEPAPDFDVWSLSLVLYEVMAGAHPFEGSSVADVLRKARRGRVPDLLRFRPNCPVTIANAFAGMLCDNRALRPQTATAFCELWRTLCADAQLGPLYSNPNASTAPLSREDH